MSAQPVDDDEWGDLEDEDDLPDDLKPKKGALPVRRAPMTPAQAAAAAKAAEARAKAQEIADRAKMLAQIVNLHIAGYSLADIGAQIGASAEEVDRMLANETARYVRNQPALRVFVRNYISGKYSEMLEAVWDKAVDKNSGHQLENFDRAQRVLAQMGRLHGAEAPTQTEMKVEAAPEAVEKLVQALSRSQGLGYDTDIFDVDEADVHEAVEQSHAALEAASVAVEEVSGNEEDNEL